MIYAVYTSHLCFSTSSRIFFKDRKCILFTAISSVSPKHWMNKWKNEWMNELAMENKITWKTKDIQKISSTCPSAILPGSVSVLRLRCKVHCCKVTAIRTKRLFTISQHWSFWFSVWGRSVQYSGDAALRDLSFWESQRFFSTLPLTYHSVNVESTEGGIPSLVRVFTRMLISF